MSEQILTESLEPEERLQKYKQYLASLGELRTGTGIADSPQTDRVNEESTDSVGASKDADVDDFKKAFTTLVVNTKEKTTSNKGKTVVLQMRSRAIDCAIQEIRHKKNILERKFERKEVSRDQYEYELAELVSEGKALLRQKEEIIQELKSAS
ncbi:MAG: hypothetical protein EAX95_13445 [Candidatus Thorarchaeota archaeon]|nr:hypothetical protein [Candidatus Thorarchaeota archaeon]